MFNYYGSKASIADLYPEPQFDLIIEPFAGSARYSLLHWERAVHLYDLSDAVVQAWQYLIAATVDDVLSLPLLQEGQTLDSAGWMSPLERNFMGFMVSAAPSKPLKQVSTRAKWTASKRSHIAAQVHKIKHWVVERQSFMAVPNQLATWFVDPPYQVRGQWYPCKLGECDYITLARKVREWKGQKIVCENLGANWLPFKPLIEVKGQHNKRNVEAVYIC